jgi:hypothetical protein
MEQNIAPIESARDWEAVATPTDDSTLTVDQAASELTRRRKEKGDVEAPVIERKYASGKKSVTLREAGDDLVFSKKLEAGKKLVDAGYATEEALEAVQSPEKPFKVGLRVADQNLDELGDRPIDQALSPHKAAEALGNWREHFAREQEEMAAALGADEDQAPAKERQPAKQAEQPQQPDPVMQERQRLAAERYQTQALQRASLAEVAIATNVQNAVNAARQRFADVRSPQDLERVRVQQPARFAELMHLREISLGGRDQLAAIAQQRQAHESRSAIQRSHARAALAAQQDALASAEIAKVLPHADRAELGRQATETLRSVGLDDRQIQAHYHGGLPVDLRWAGAQLLIAKAAAYDSMQAKAKQVRQTPLPPVQKPGTARPRGAAEAQRVSDLKSQLRGARGNKALELGMELLRAQRASGA